MLDHKNHSIKNENKKFLFFCNVPEQHVIAAPDIESIYQVPINFKKQKLPELVASLLGLRLSRGGTRSEKQWEQLVRCITTCREEVHIAVIGKYFETGDFVLSDAYLSVIEAVKFSSYALGKKPVLTWLSAEVFEKEPHKVRTLSGFDGILIPGGFGNRGVEGKIKAIKYAREHKIPYFGLCYGMQLAVIEYARHVAGIKGATTREISPTSNECVIDIMDEQKEKMKKEHYGGSMRLGTYEARLKKGTIAQKAYQTMTIKERHRHRFEVNPLFIPQLEKAGIVFSGISPDGTLMEIAELPTKEHPFFLGTQYHPEFQARPLSPHPLFSAFINAALRYGKNKKRK